MRVLRWRRVLVLFASICVALALVAPAPGRAQVTRGYEQVDFGLYSVHVDDTLWTRVRVPEGPPPAGGWPVLYLFHGHGENHTTWTAPIAGDLDGVVPDLKAVVVMPEARAGWLTDHHDNLLKDVNWTRYFLEELVPYVDKTFPVSRSRGRRAVGGASMGGMGAVLLASQRPDWFGTVVSLSGALDHQHPLVATAIDLANTADGGYHGIFGPRDGHYATGHNPARLTANLTATRTMVFVGDGTPDPDAVEADRWSADQRMVDKLFLAAFGVPLEVVSREEAESFVAAARADDVPVTYEVSAGTHEWPLLRRQLVRAVEQGLFWKGTPPDAWSYRTVRRQGRAWAFRYEFSARPPALVTFTYGEGILRATGAGEVTIDGPGCRFTAIVPFERACPVGSVAPHSAAGLARATAER